MGFRSRSWPSEACVGPQPPLGASDRFAACDICHQPACPASDLASQGGMWPASAALCGERQTVASPCLVKCHLYACWPLPRGCSGLSWDPDEFPSTSHCRPSQFTHSLLKLRIEFSNRKQRDYEPTYLCCLEIAGLVCEDLGGLLPLVSV